MGRQLRQTLWSGRHLFGLRWENVPERDVRGAGRQRHVDLHIIMGRNAQPQTDVTDRVEIGRFQIFLSQMHAVRLVFNRQPPVVVDKQAGVVATSQRDSGDHVGLHLFIAFILNA